MKTPLLSGKAVVKMLMHVGYYVRDQKGSHIHLRHSTRPPLTVPRHKEIARGTLRQIVKDAGLTMDEFLRLA